MMDEDSRKRKESTPPAASTPKAIKLHDSVLNISQTTHNSPILSSQSTNSPQSTCPCKTVIKSPTIKCGECNWVWHVACVGLAGVTVYLVKQIEGWKCPLCFKFSEEISANLQCPEEQDPISPVSADTAKIVKRLADLELNIEKKLEDLKVSTESTHSPLSGWSDLFKKDEPKKLIEKVVEQSSEVALQKSIQLIDANLTEQRKRCRNVIMSGVPEIPDEDIRRTVLTNLNDECESRDIVDCKRLGKLNKPKKDGPASPPKPRPILIIFRNESDALQYHNYGRGRKVFRNRNIWINPDLTRTEREALYLQREKRKQNKLSSRSESVSVNKADIDAAKPQTDTVKNADGALQPDVTASGPADSSTLHHETLNQ